MNIVFIVKNCDIIRSGEMVSRRITIILALVIGSTLVASANAECPLDHYFIKQANGRLLVDTIRIYQHGVPGEGHYALSWSPIFQRWSVGEPGFSDTTDPAYGFPLESQLEGTPGLDYDICFEVLDLSPDFKIQMNDGTWLETIGDRYNLSNWTEHHVHMKYCAYVPNSPVPDYPFYVTYRLVDDLGLYQPTPPFSLVFNVATSTVQETDPEYRGVLPSVTNAMISFTFHRPITVAGGPPVTITDETTQSEDYYTDYFDYFVSSTGLSLTLTQIGGELPNSTYLEIVLTDYIRDAATGFAVVPFTHYVQTLYLPGNCDGDSDLDLDDFAVFAVCMNGPASSVIGYCQCADLDSDGNVDLVDFAEFTRFFTNASSLKKSLCGGLY